MEEMIKAYSQINVLLVKKCTRHMSVALKCALNIFRDRRMQWAVKLFGVFFDGAELGFLLADF